MVKLITGGTGNIGAELAHILVQRGEDVVLFDRTIKHHRINIIEKQVRIVQGDLSNRSEVMNAVKNNKISVIYHIGAMLSYACEQNPWSAFQSNVIGTYNVLEAARLFDVEQVMFASSGATFSLELGPETTDTTIQRPTTIYGVTKLQGEGMGRYYRTRFGLDFRSIRYPAVTGPGVKNPAHWHSAMIECAILGEPFECPVTEESTLSTILFIKDAGRAADMVLQAPKEKIKMVNYNIAGVPVKISAKELEREIKKQIPGAIITYKPDPEVMEIQKLHSSINVFDDSYAREEWAWKPENNTVGGVVSAFIHKIINNSHQHPS
jgi:threonine 3-dehydrogenase